MSLCEAANYGDLESVKRLLDEGADIHAGNGEALRNASWKGHIKVVLMLLDRGANAHAVNDLALRYANYNGHSEVVELLENYEIWEKYYKLWRRHTAIKWARRLLQVWFRLDMPGGKQSKRNIAKI